METCRHAYTSYGMIRPMAHTAPEPPDDDRPVGPVPEDPDAQRAWADRFTDELMLRPHDEWSSAPVHDTPRRQP